MCATYKEKKSYFHNCIDDDGSVTQNSNWTNLFFSTSQLASFSSLYFCSCYFRSLGWKNGSLLRSRKQNLLNIQKFEFGETKKFRSHILILKIQFFFPCAATNLLFSGVAVDVPRLALLPIDAVDLDDVLPGEGFSCRRRARRRPHRLRRCRRSRGSSCHAAAAWSASSPCNCPRWGCPVRRWRRRTPIEGQKWGDVSLEGDWSN